MKLVTTFSAFLSEINKNIDGVNVLPMPLSDVYWESQGHIGYDQLTHIIPDGMPLVWYLKINGYQAERLYGPDFMIALINQYSKKKHQFLGTNQILFQLKALLRLEKASYLELGFEKDGEKLIPTQIEKKILAFKPDFIWIGVGSPKQLSVSKKIRTFYKKGLIGCVGAAFNLNVDTSKQAPRLLKDLGLEWFYRLILEPKRLWRRYLFYSPLGLLALPALINKVTIVPSKK